MYLRIYVFMYVYVCMCIRHYVFAFMYVCMYAWFYVRDCMYVCMFFVFMLYIPRYLLSKHLTVSNLDQSKFTLKEHTISVCP